MVDSVVKKVAPLACTRLESQKGCSDVFPDELEKHFGDPILFKVRKHYDCHSCGAISVEVLDIHFDSDLLDIYFNPNHHAYFKKEVLVNNVESSSFFNPKLNFVDTKAEFSKSIESVDQIVPSIESNFSILDSYIGNRSVKRLKDFFVSKDDGVCVVFGWYDSVLEGVDMWYPDDQSSIQPRFRLKLKIHDESNEAIFILLDDQVKKLALETCSLLVSIGESCSMYPNDLDLICGDAVLIKVVKKVSVDSKETASF
ncbi:uncharacterized protein LOC123916508 [Trifolium pratense]|uniref:uncharacterized protein LOC123916508 n=1 Tax=Trifolium pratense TaxID=57577 RepID=UPI001E693089|nr:uncharacterized protein LOC123916508 [Trifolium pratense]XP_045823934.1 uncharacterized protein LOC123916508 [Trifolium pratense]